jgi:predicted oxidoreductase (fatty acid repression mutant protein)
LAEFIGEILKTLPTPWNFQTERLVVLLNDEHKKFWQLAKVGQSQYGVQMMDRFMHAHGTILFLIDDASVRRMEKTFPVHAQSCQGWAVESNAMTQFAIWTGLSTIGYGANIQHYHPLTSDQLADEFNLPKGWTLVAEMPFGIGNGDLPEHKHLDTDERLFVRG